PGTVIAGSLSRGAARRVADGRSLAEIGGRGGNSAAGIEGVSDGSLGAASGNFTELPGVGARNGSTALTGVSSDGPRFDGDAARGSGGGVARGGGGGVVFSGRGGGSEETWAGGAISVGAAAPGAQPPGAVAPGPHGGGAGAPPHAGGSDW